MPADTAARYYQWFMTDDPRSRIVAYEWWPDGGELMSSMTPGTLHMMQRESPGDTWGPPRVVARQLPWTVAQSFTRREGFTVEVAVKEDA
jgi:hypothetical protein